MYPEIYIDKNKLRVDSKGIYVNRKSFRAVEEVSKTAWERIYSHGIHELKVCRKEFDQDKLIDHINYLNNTYKFTDRTVYLEIGCGPAHIAEYLMKTFDCTFIGMDFNYKMLVTLKKYLDDKGYKNYILIHADINDMPLNPSCVDYIYGGGVIEHFPNTQHVLSQCHKVLKKGGVIFNTVPAMTLWWVLNFHNTIPNIPVIRELFELFHRKILKDKLLASNYGYQLGFTKTSLIRMHRELGYENISSGSFAIHASKKKLKNHVLSNIYYFIQGFPLTAAVYYVTGSKK